jgi:hypothetical protein
MAGVFADAGDVERQRAAMPQPRRKQAPVLPLIAAIAHEAIAAAPDVPEVEVRGDIQKGAQVATARHAVPGVQLFATGNRGDLLELRAEGHRFKESAKFAQAALQAEQLRALQRPRRAARLHCQSVRPFAGKQAHHLHEARACRQYLVGRAARDGAKALRRAVVPAPTFVFLAREVGHEEQVEVRQVIRQVLHRPRVRLAARRPLGGGVAPAASASARAAAADWATEQMPQMRGTSTSASAGSLPCRICSKPRYSGEFT